MKYKYIPIKPRAVVYFQIVGTHNTANEVFHAVHFESPAQPDSLTRRPGRISPHVVEPVEELGQNYQIIMASSKNMCSDM